MERRTAYRVLSVKALEGAEDAPLRITGTASTATPDRRGDVVEPAGAVFPTEIPLLLGHDHKTPVGRAWLRLAGHAILFDAELPAVTRPGIVRDRVNEARDALTYGLVWMVSIGFRALGDGAIEVLKTGGLRFLKSEILELSLVTVPANPDAALAVIKALETDPEAAAGLTTRPGDAGALRQGPIRMTTQTTTEQIQSYEAAIAARMNRLEAIRTAAGAEQHTLAGAEAEEFDTAQGEIESFQKDIKRLKALEQLQLARATPVPAAANGRPAEARAAAISVRPNILPGAAFVRMQCALIHCKGNRLEAAQYAERWRDSTPEVSLYLKAAIAPGTTTDATWAAPLANPANLVDEFMALLRPKTAIGQITGWRKVPFNTPVPAQTGGGTYNWVGQGKPKPVTKLAFSSTMLPPSKVAGIIAITEELARLSSPDAEEIARNDMIAGIVTFVDSQLLDPAVAAVANVHPASLTNGVTPITSVGPLNDIVAIAAAFSAANLPLAGLTYVMSPNNALVLSFLKEPNGAQSFPGVGLEGGSLNGLKVVTSAAAGNNIIGILPPLVLYGELGGVTIDVSREATVQMSDTPMDPVDATTTYVSFWQNNLVGLRAEWFIAWLKANANAVKYVENTAFVLPAPTGGGAPVLAQGPAGKGR